MVRVYRKDLGFGQGTDGQNYYEVSEERARELEAVGYKRNPAEADVGRADPGGSIFTGTDSPDFYADSPNTSAPNVDFGYQKGLEKASALYSFLSPNLLETFAQSWAKYGDANIAMGAVRKSNTWKQEFGYLQRTDGTLIMSEIDALATIATYKSTLAEVGITDFNAFEKQFENLIANEVSGLEFQQRIDTVYEGVSNQIPEVERLFRNRFNISLDAPTIFGALINPDIQDKVLAGDIATLQLQAQASSRGFSTTFARFDELRKQGLNVQEASSLYESAQDIMSSARGVGRQIDLAALEDAAIGDIESRKEIARAADELQSASSFVTGSRQKCYRVIGLTER